MNHQLTPSAFIERPLLRTLEFDPRMDSRKLPHRAEPYQLTQR